MPSRRLLVRTVLLLTSLPFSGGFLVERAPEQNAGAALAQSFDDTPGSFTRSLIEQDSPGSVAVHHIVYVPAYSSIRLGSGKGEVGLATTLSVHNTSAEGTLTLLRVDYYDTSGDLIRQYAPEPITIRPLGAVEAFVPVEDTRGGSGANFVVEWTSEALNMKPLIEAIMLGEQGARSYSFTSRGEEVELARPEP